MNSKMVQLAVASLAIVLCTMVSAPPLALGADKCSTSDIHGTSTSADAASPKTEDEDAPESLEGRSWFAPDHDENASELGGVTCTGPVHCSKLCFAAQKYCVEYAGHPHKPEVKPGELYDCIDSIPSAGSGGSYTCLYRYENGDACIFSYGAKFGPIHPPAPPPLCVYKGGKP